MRYSDDDPEDEARITAWGRWEEHDGRRYPILSCTVDKGSVSEVRGWPGTVTTEPCIWCGKKHHHGNLEGSRVPHCADHTHELTPTGKRRSVWAKGMKRCPNDHRDYILKVQSDG